MNTPGQKPLKRHDSLIPYSRDHHHGLLLVWKIRQGLKKGTELQRIADYLGHFFPRYLAPHFAAEEESLLSTLDHNGAMHQEVIDDHAYLAGLVHKLAKNPDTQNLATFADRLEKHIRFEERVLFQHLQEVLPADMPSDYQGSPPLDDDWTDAFWLETARPTGLRIDPDEMEWSPGKVQSFYGKELLMQPHATLKLVKAEPKSSYPEHRHADRTEFAYVLEGRPRFSIGGEIFQAKPHEYYLFPANTPHAIANEHGEPAILLVGSFTPNPVQS